MLNWQANVVFELIATEQVELLFKADLVLAAGVQILVWFLDELPSFEWADLEIEGWSPIDQQLVSEDVWVSLRVLIETHLLCEY